MRLGSVSTGYRLNHDPSFAALGRAGLSCRDCLLRRKPVLAGLPPSETLTATAEDSTQALAAAVWLVLNTPGVLTERFDEVEVYEQTEDDLGLSAWITRHEDRNYLTRFTRIEAVKGGSGGNDAALIYSYRIDAEDAGRTLREVRCRAG